MKEEDARKKWCPMTRVRDYGANEPATNRDIRGKILTTQHCIASDCMMWTKCTFVNEETGNIDKGGRCGLINT